MILEQLFKDFKIRNFEEFFNNILADKRVQGPKDVERAKDIARKCAQSLTSLRNGVTRTIADLYFIEISEFKERVKRYRNINVEAISEEELNRYDSVLDMVTQIDNLKDKIGGEKLLEFCQQAYSEIIERSKTEDPQKWLERLVDILKDKKSDSIANFLQEIEKKLKTVKQNQFDEKEISSSSSILQSNDVKSDQASSSSILLSSFSNVRGNDRSTSKSKKLKKKEHNTKEEVVEPIKDLQELRDIIQSRIDRAITLEVLEQKLGNILSRRANSYKKQEHNQQLLNKIMDFTSEIAAESLTASYKKGGSMLYYMVKYGLLRNIYNKLEASKFRILSNKITTEALNRIGPCG